MPGIAYWIKHYLLAATTMFIILMVAELAKGANWRDGVLSALAWACAAAAIFIGSRYHKARKGIACQVCETITSEKTKK